MVKDTPPPPQLNAEFYRRRNEMQIYFDKSTAGKPAGAEPAHAPTAPPPPPPQQPPGSGAPPPQPPRGPPPPPKPPSFGRRFAHNVVGPIGKSLRFGGKVIGFVAVAGIAHHYYEARVVDQFFHAPPPTKEEDKENKELTGKKKVLVLPFNNLKVIEQRKSGGIQDILNPTGVSSVLDKNKQPTITMEVKELVNVIHEAASDPNITALYADFGEGLRYDLGYAHLEEIRNAIRIFNESHRVHRNPNVDHNPIFAMMRNGNPKPSYAFGHGYNWKEYFLASAFSFVHLQARGNLSLFGVSTSNVFFRGWLDKYGVKAHVFRHGEYKNAPSIFTDKKYSPAHLETVRSMTSSLDNTIRTCIENSRALNFDNVMWESIFEYGSLTPHNALEIGLVDTTPPVDPMLSLLDENKGEQNSKENDLFLRFGLHESFGKFKAQESVPLVLYKTMLNKREKVESRKKMVNDQLQKLAESSTATSMIFSVFGWKSEDNKKRDKVAVLTVNGTIASTLSYEIVNSLRQIRKDKDVKSVVLRVNSPGGSVTSSEAILEEIKLLDKPVICSMSNAAASGGYYISMNCDKIFAQPTTLTGSIGVYGVKFDASKWAKSYGIHSDHYPRGSHAATMGALTPLTPRMKENISRVVLDFYDYFKSIVAEGRSLPVDYVEKVAQGRVWTGEQAKEVGLVDNIGGLDRAISYAKIAHTKSDEVDVEYYPKNSFSLSEVMQQSMGQGSFVDIFQAIIATSIGMDEDAKPKSFEQLLSEMTEMKFAEKPHFMLTMDEKTAMELIMGGE